jgi:hypothetical protein
VAFQIIKIINIVQWAIMVEKRHLLGLGPFQVICPSSYMICFVPLLMGLGLRFFNFSSLGSSLCAVFLGVVFVWTSIFIYFFLFPCEMFFIYLFVKVFYKITMYLMKVLAITHPPNWFYQKKPNKPKNNSRGEDTIAIFTNPTKT